MRDELETHFENLGMFWESYSEYEVELIVQH